MAGRYNGSPDEVFTSTELGGYAFGLVYTDPVWAPKTIPLAKQHAESPNRNKSPDEVQYQTEPLWPVSLAAPPGGTLRRWKEDEARFGLPVLSR